MTTITLTKEHGYVLGVAVASVFVLQWMALKVGLARKAAHVEYPNMYATDTEAKENKAKFIFNCAQRGHQKYYLNMSNGC
jgi:glutathione S-transferase